ncbi:cell envelope biogenesis protein OmpA [Zobellella denitrificans]|uniref:Cell envelope biogenesis protein OmpA n=1 Tax=Zobellella denitrificans TaxID=347534 RepID=A0A291HMH3_9GAMM|nr:OmpA family protein [Zobellella denitrificans]ATG73325.1 cell envelope biogenesis protein OmpA [Zobellella denitrificans]
MKKTVAPSLISIALATAGISSAVQANDWYLGAGAGYANYEDIDSHIADADEDAEAVTMFGGYNFNQYFGAELGFNHFGGDADAKALNLSAIGRLPLNNQFSVFGELGALGWDVDTAHGDRGVSPLAGLGLTYRVSDLVDVQARYRRIEDMGDLSKNGFETDVNNVMLELVLHPNRGTPAPAPVAPVAPQPQPEVTYETRTVTADGSIYFAFDKSDLSAESRATLDEVARFAQQNPDYQVELAGYADRLGTAEYNRRLSERRAMAAKDYLIQRGVAAQNIQTAWYGSELAEGVTEAERQRDRRVDAKAQATIQVEIIE